MLSLPPSVRIFVATQPVDGRKGVDSLVAIVRSAFAQDPLSGHLYAFFSRRSDRVRIVYWDRNGFAMWTKRLEKGRFHARRAEDRVLGIEAIAAQRPQCPILRRWWRAYRAPQFTSKRGCASALRSVPTTPTEPRRTETVPLR